MSSWSFYGRQVEVDHLVHTFQRARWFFVKVSGRRRIGKTSLVQEALRAARRDQLLYVQFPDSDPAGVIAAARDFFDTFGVPGPRPHDLRSLATCIASLIELGYIVALDEFQYFHRPSLYEFTSHLQAEVDRLALGGSPIAGGLLVLGSIHTEMSALLEDRSAPLFNRVSDSVHLGHLDVASILEMLRAHADDSPERLLFLWNLFEGVPKFYRDCFEQGVLDADRRTLLARMFFASSSPLRTEADNWFLRELRGRYDLVLKYVARHPGCTNADLEAHARSVDPHGHAQVGGYIKILRERYQMIERLQPIFAKPTGRNGRFYLRDNFLRSWLAALATTTAAVNFRPLESLVAESDQRLQEVEGHGLERLAGTLFEERSRRGLGDFALTERIQGYWDRQGTEVDLVALDETSHLIRLCTCKRNTDRLVADVPRFEGHVARFHEAIPRFRGWTVQKVGITLRHTADSRRALEARGIIPRDLVDLTDGL